MAMFNPNPMGFQTYRKNSGLKTVFSIVSIVFAVYFLNYPFSFFVVPESIVKYENWIVFAGGILILIGMINFLRATKKFM